jgi:hypothetical protein
VRFRACCCSHCIELYILEREGCCGLAWPAINAHVLEREGERRCLRRGIRFRNGRFGGGDRGPPATARLTDRACGYVDWAARTVPAYDGPSRTARAAKVQTRPASLQTQTTLHHATQENETLPFITTVKANILAHTFATLPTSVTSYI